MLFVLSPTPFQEQCIYCILKSRDTTAVHNSNYYVTSEGNWLHQNPKEGYIYFLFVNTFPNYIDFSQPLQYYELFCGDFQVVKLQNVGKFKAVNIYARQCNCFRLQDVGLTAKMVSE